MPSDALAEAAKLLGREHGKARAETVMHGANCDIHTAEIIIKGHANGNPQVTGLCPEPLSGEWADDPPPMAILDEIANKAGMKGKMYKTATDIEGDLLDIYESAFQDGFWEWMLFRCTNIVKGVA